MSQPGYPMRGDIYWADLEPVAGSEQGKARPVLIMSNNLMNKNTSIVAIVPMTTDNDPELPETPFYIPIKLEDIELDQQGIKNLKTLGPIYTPRDSILLGSHGRTVDKVRLKGRVGKCINENVLIRVEASIIDAYGINACITCGIPLRPNGLSCSQCKKIYRIKCYNCGLIFDIKYNFCPFCGGRLK